jgi:hypothetical protein
LLNGPRDISIIRDCGNFYGYVTNENNNTMILLEFGNDITSVPTASDLGNFAGFSGPRYLTRFIRDRDNIYGFTANNLGNSISRLTYNSCTNSSIPNSALQTPPVFSYDSPGLYNVYLAVDEGLPTMLVDCKQIRILPKPLMTINNDTTICQGDTVLIVGNGIGLLNITWDPVYNGIPPFDSTAMQIFPREDYRYHAHMEFRADGTCNFDTSVLVKVSRITADAGPDIFVADGAYTILGGPRMSMGENYKYQWYPATYLDNTQIPNPTSKPTDVIAYYLIVKDTISGCEAFDTVWVRTACTEINMPNVFNPMSNIPENRFFGLLNVNVVKLEYFRVFNRWGELVFETTNPTVKWDGRHKGLDLPPDNYVWIIDGYCNNGKRIRKTGTVLLAR